MDKFILKAGVSIFKMSGDCEIKTKKFQIKNVSFIF